MPDQSENPASGSWQTELLRLSVFTAVPPRVGEHSWWTAVTGQQPETSTVKAKAGEQVQDGPFSDGSLAIQIAPQRVDWLYRATGDPLRQSSFPSVGTVDEALNAFSPPLLSWLGLEDVPPIRRIAFGAVLLQPNPSMVGAYEGLKRYVRHLDFDPETTTDLMFVINRFRPSGVMHSMRINRITNWSVANFQQVEINFDSPSPRPFLAPPEYAVRVEMDINTDQQFPGLFDAPMAQRLFEELIELSREIAERGDIR